MIMGFPCTLAANDFYVAGFCATLAQKWPHPRFHKGLPVLLYKMFASFLVHDGESLAKMVLSYISLLATFGLLAAKEFPTRGGAFALTSQCNLAPPPSSVPTCRKKVVGWWYDPQMETCTTSESCQEAPFTALNECLAACRPNLCLQKPETGPCRARTIGFYFQRGRCKPFVWGGCRGNVPFWSLSECQYRCENKPRATFLGFDHRCSLQSERSAICLTGKMVMEAFFYNHYRLTCEKGIWKGCSASEPFFSLRECNSACIPQSLLPPN